MGTLHIITMHTVLIMTITRAKFGSSHFMTPLNLNKWQKCSITLKRDMNIFAV